MNFAYQNVIKALGPSRVTVDEELKNYTSVKIGGPASLFFKARQKEELITAVSTAKINKIDFFILGGGTNVIFSDKGFKGLVIKNETGDIKLKALTGGRIKASSKKNIVKKVFLEVSSGVTINRLVRNTVDQGLKGLEYFLGQPGTVGGAIWINAHNINNSIYFGDYVVSAKLLNKNNEEYEVQRQYFKFSYDHSHIQKTEDIVLSVLLGLETGEKEELWLEAKKALLYRQQTQPQGVNSAGCLFRNIDKSDALRLATPQYTCSAGFLLDSVGLKGKIIGQVKLSEHHANFLLNLGGGKLSDVLELINLAKAKVRKKYGVDLKLEVNIPINKS